MKDALGNDLVVGNLYGYSTSTNGNTRVVLGYYKSHGKNRVSLDVKSIRTFLYGEETFGRYSEDAKTVSVQSCHLFPVKEQP